MCHTGHNVDLTDRDRKQIYEASDWFKEALQKNQVCTCTSLFIYAFAYSCADFTKLRF